MNHVAQNALLKLLEEPNSSFHFIVTSHAPDKLLSTIRSRVQSMSVSPISGLESKRLLTSMGVTDDVTIQRLLYVAEGLPAELTRLIKNEADFKSLSERVMRARQFAEGVAYQRLAVVMSSSDDRQSALKFIETVNLLLRRSFDRSPDPSSLRRIDSLLQASDAIRFNGNVKLHLVSAALQQ
jgi:DNA polymerase-3 subunit delta'